MAHRIAKLETMAKVLADFAREATEMNEHQLASLLIEAMAEAERRVKGIAASLPAADEAALAQEQKGPPS